MQLNEINYSGARPFDGYGPGFFRIGGQVLNGAILVLPGGISDWGGYGDTAALIAVADRLDVLFVGTGAEPAHIPVEFRQILETAGIGVEPMPTPSACRTYNVLLAEGRRVGAALWPV